MPDQNSASTEHALMQEITAPLAKLPHDPVPEVANVDFPVVLRGYDRLAVDAYVKRISQLVAELDASRSPQHAVRRALERVGQEVSGILQRAHETADQITSQSRVEAEDRLDSARREAETLVADARREAETLLVDGRQRLKDLDAETDRIWEERHRIVEDARSLAAQLLTMAESAIERFPAAEEVPAAETGPLAAHEALPTADDADLLATDEADLLAADEEDLLATRENGLVADEFENSGEPPVSQDTLPIEPAEPFDHESD
jgi:DivIVA domain-containing protein